MAPSSKKKKEPVTAGDQFVCAFCGAVLGFVVWTVIYGIWFIILIKSGGGRDRPSLGEVDALDGLPPFWWGGVFALGCAVFGLIVGAERMMDFFEKVFKGIGRLFGGNKDD